MTAEFIVAVHALVYLNHKGDYRSSEEIAQNVCTNPARVRKVMAKLKKAGIIQTHAGFVGGYRFAKRAEDITLLDVFNAAGEKLIKTNWRSGSAEMDCPIAVNMGPIMDEVFAALESCCGGKLKEITLAQIDARIFPPQA